MHDDDAPVGRVLSRREVVALLGGAGAGLSVLPKLPSKRWLLINGLSVPACVVRPAQTEGPYFVDTRLNRSDIRPDAGTSSPPAGIPLELTVNVFRMSGTACAPLAGVLVDLWQCDAAGIYSGVRDTQGLFDTTGKTFLRGHQVSDREGHARFTTIYPGWYPGRTVHIHFKLRTQPGGQQGREFTSQLYFEDEVSDRIFAKQPYAANPARRVRNQGDGIFRRGGLELMVPIEEKGNALTGSFDVALQF